MELESYSMTFFVILIATIISRGFVHAQFICTDTCDQNGSSQLIASSPSECCSSSLVNGYYPLLVGSSFEDCQPCPDFSSLQAQIMTTVTPSNIVINRDAQFTCDITSANPDIDVEATIQWLGPNGTVLAESGPNDNSLDLDFEPFRLSDVGDYTCTAKVSSPDLPSSIMSVISRTISFTPPTNIPVSVSITQSQPPFAGDPYTLTCTITQEGQTIEWIDSDGNVINSGNGIEVGETMSGSGVTTRTLTFTNLRSNDTGRYTCRNPIRDATQRLITGFRSPEVIITEPSSPMFGAPFRPTCTASLPQEVQDGNLTVSWIGPDGSVLASVSTMDQSASVDLPITTLETSDFGTYICRAVVTSPFLDRSVVSSGTLNLGGSIQTPPPVTNPPSQPSEPSGPVPSTQPSQPPPPATDPSTASQSPATPQSTTQRVTTMRPATSAPPPPAPVNECVLGRDNCSRKQKCFRNRNRMRDCIPVARCIDRDEGFECRCNPGFEGDGVTCADINECAREVDNCHAEARCLNKPGGFKCKCRYGFIGDGVQCCIRREDALSFMDPEAGMDETRTKKTKRTKTTRRRTRRHAKSRKRTKSTKKRTKGTKTQDIIVPTEQAPAFDENCRAFVIAYNDQLNSNTKSRKTSKTRKTRRRTSRS